MPKTKAMGFCTIFFIFGFCLKVLKKFLKFLKLLKLRISRSRFNLGLLL